MNNKISRAITSNLANSRLNKRMIVKINNI